MSPERGRCVVCATEYAPATPVGCPYCYALRQASECFWDMVLWLAAMRAPLEVADLHSMVDRFLAFEGCLNPGHLAALAARPDVFPSVLQ